MELLRFAAALAVAALLARPTLANSFGALGLWDPLPLDAGVYAPASVGAAIAAANARINAMRTPNTDAGVGPAGNPVRQTCSLQVGSISLPSNRRSDNNTFVTNANVTGTIIQVCR